MKHKLIDYSKIGYRLKFVRQRKGLSLEQIYEATRIQPSILRDIEEGKVSISPVFLKGFIKTYALFLGLSVEDVFKEGEKKIQKKQPETTKPVPDEKNKLQDYVRYLWIVSGAFLLFLVIGVITVYKKTNEGEKTDVSSEKEAYKNHVGSLTDEQNEPVEDLFQNLNFLEQIKRSVFTQELLIKTSEPVEIYFKLDNHFTFTKHLPSTTWFLVKARQSIYLRFDENLGHVIIFYNGQETDTITNEYFERTFGKDEVKNL